MLPEPLPPALAEPGPDPVPTGTTSPGAPGVSGNDMDPNTGTLPVTGTTVAPAAGLPEPAPLADSVPEPVPVDGDNTGRLATGAGVGAEPTSTLGGGGASTTLCSLTLALWNSSPTL